MIGKIIHPEQSNRVDYLQILSRIFNMYTTSSITFVVKFDISNYIGKSFDLSANLILYSGTYVNWSDSGISAYCIEIIKTDGTIQHIGPSPAARNADYTPNITVPANEIDKLKLYVCGCFNRKNENNYNGIKNFSVNITSNGITEQLFPYLD